MVLNWALILWILAAVALLGVYPITYLAYRGFVAETHQTRLKDDFRLLGLVKEDELEATVRGLYQTAYNPLAVCGVYSTDRSCLCPDFGGIRSKNKS